MVPKTVKVSIYANMPSDAVNHQFQLTIRKGSPKDIRGDSPSPAVDSPNPGPWIIPNPRNLTS